jgi:alpha-D-ribose 1-methylphosphonate 5-triphosphate diphosphatase
VSEFPANAVGLDDRGRIAPGLRADLVLVDPALPGRPRVVAVLVAGRIVHLTEAGRLAS